MPSTIFSTEHSALQIAIGELRDVHLQKDSMRFRWNVERIGKWMAYEISKKLAYQPISIETSLGVAEGAQYQRKVVVASILRAGLPMHQGCLQVFDSAENAFISAYRKHHRDGSFEIQCEYVSCPTLTDKIVILADPMLATGSSCEYAIHELLKYGNPHELHIATIIASRQGMDHIRRKFPQAHCWIGVLDEELTARSYIVPGLGDAGDLSYGEKLQE